MVCIYSNVFFISFDHLQQQPSPHMCSQEKGSSQNEDGENERGLRFGANLLPLLWLWARCYALLTSIKHSRHHHRERPQWSEASRGGDLSLCHLTNHTSFYVISMFRTRAVPRSCSRISTQTACSGGVYSSCQSRDVFRVLLQGAFLARWFNKKLSFILSYNKWYLITVICLMLASSLISLFTI